MKVVVKRQKYEYGVYMSVLRLQIIKTDYKKKTYFKYVVSQSAEMNQLILENLWLWERVTFYFVAYFQVNLDINSGVYLTLILTLNFIFWVNF